MSLAPAPRNRLARAMAEFHASFVCTPADGGTTVARELVFRPRPLVRPLLGPLLRRRLPQEVDDELARAKAHLEAASVHAR